MDIFKFFLDYPLGYISHWSQGIIIGFLMCIAARRKNISLSIIGVVFASYFALYESLEYARTHDFGDVDVENWLLAFTIGCVLFCIGRFFHPHLNTFSNKLKSYKAD